MHKIREETAPGKDQYHHQQPQESLPRLIRESFPLSEASPKGLGEESGFIFNAQITMKNSKAHKKTRKYGPIKEIKLISRNWPLKK